MVTRDGIHIASSGEPETFTSLDGLADLPEAVVGWHAFLLRKTAQQITDRVHEKLAASGLTLRHFGVLNLVAAQPGQSQRSIGMRLQIDRTTIVTIIDDLERGGLLDRRTGPDRRTYALYLTHVGATQLRHLSKLVTAAQDDFLAPLSTQERETLKILLRRLL